MMAITVTDLAPGPAPSLAGGSSPLVVVAKSITFDSSYPNTGGTVGEPITAAQLRLASITAAFIEPAGGRVFSYDSTNGVIHAYQGTNSAAALPEVPNATNLSAITTRIVAVGTPISGD